ncbi:dihydropteroate synthase [Thiobacillus thioparus]|uniref:dihydropteroate synthase n=1 Tax=Thiobacillus thioparus TaxID=931 RepID=UPI00036F7ACE|nr:dihydropteroate synthase [Thiobacillus thioparus]
MSVLHAGSHRLPLSRPRIMGVVNVTSDSFSDGGQLHDTQAAITHALKLSEQGADILDVGGESTRPGATAVPVDEEIRRVVPVIEALAREGCLVSVDTRKPGVMRAALAAGATMVNDVAALQASDAMEAVAASGAAVCLMHMQGDPQSMQQSPRYADVVDEVKQFLRARVQVCEAAGIARERLVIDPGFGFGKTLQHNLALLKHLGGLAELGVPILAGLSRKSMLGSLTGRAVDEREFAGVAAHLMAVAQGARLVRVHNVMAMRDALAIWNAVEEYKDGT